MPKPRFLSGLHRWIALGFAPLLSIQAATGAVLLFRDDLAQLTMRAPEGPPGEVAPLSALVEAAQAAHPDLRLTRLFYPAMKGSAAFAQLESGYGTVRYAALDPTGGKVISAGSIWRYPIEAALQIHYRLMSGTFGLTVVALNGLALALIALSGLWHWWPGARRVTRELTAPARAPARLKMRTWHRTLGAVLGVVLMTSATTGVLLSAPNLPLFAPAAATPAAPVALDPANIDRAFALARSTYPRSQPRDVRFAPDGTASFNFFAPRGGKWGVDVVTVRRGKVVSKVPLEENSAMWLVALPIHTGDTIGAAGRWPMLAAALALMVLAGSGPLLWWRRTRKRLLP